jgi:ubiquinone biosynthesis protein UbiJ
MLITNTNTHRPHKGHFPALICGLILGFFAVNDTMAQMGISNVSITPHSSSILELRSNTLGFLPPRMTAIERNAIPSPAAGLVVYNTTSSQLNYYDGISWQLIAGGGGIISLNGLTGNAQTFVNGANVTITSSGTTHTLGWNGQLSVANGGTGLATLGGTNSLLFTTTTDNISSIPTLNNATLVTNGSGVPSLSTTLPAVVQNNITSVGTVASGTWSATPIADNKITSSLTGKTYNGLTLTPQAAGFTIAGGTTSKTLTVPLDATVSGVNTGDQTTVSGNAGTATLTAITDDNATVATMYPTWVTANSGNQAQKVSSTKLSFNPSTGTLTSISFAGNLTGNASTVTTNANLTGDITSVGNATTISANAVTTAKILNATITYAKMQNVSATNMVLGRVSAGAGVVEEIPTSGSGNVARVTSPTFVTPVLGAASGTSLNKVTITAPATGSTLTIADGKTLSVPLDATVSGVNTGDQTTIAGNAGSTTLTAITDDNATAATMYPTWVTTNSGNQAQKVSSTKLSFNPSTGTLTSTAFAGALTGNVTGNVSGNAGTVTTNANLTGDVTSVGNATTIAANAVTYAKIQNISASNVVLGRVTAGAGTIEEIATTGSGNVVRAIAPTLVTPTLGFATASTLNKVTITTPAIGSTLTIADGKTLSVPLDATVSGVNTGDQTTIAGNAGSASLIAITDDNATAATMYPTWVTTNSGNQAQKVSSTKLSFNPSTGTLTSTAFAGALTGNVTGNLTGNVTGNVSGNAGTVTTNANLTGDVTSVGNATTIATNAVTYSKIQNISASNVVLGRVTAGAGTIEEIATTGSGNVVRAIAPTLVTPTLGVATASTLNKVTITAPATGSTLTITDGKTLSVPLDATVSGVNTGDQTTIAGNAGSASLTAITDDNATAATMYPTWVTTNSGNQAQKVSSTKLSFNPSTGTLTSTAFSGALTGNVTGNVSGSAGSSSLTAITDDNATVATMYPTWVTSTSGNQSQKVSSTKLSFNPSTGILTSTGFAGNLTGNITGNAATVTTNANLTGDITSIGNATSIASNVIVTNDIINSNITYAKIQNVSASNMVLGRVTAGAGIVEEIPTTGSGNVVRATSPTLVTPALGVATATSVNKVAITTPATGSTLTIGDGKTLTVLLDATVSGTNTGDQTTITGNAGSATLITITDDNATAAMMYPTWVTSTSGNQSQKVSSTKLSFNPLAGILTSTGFAGNLTGNVTGNATTVTTNANLTGAVTSVGNITTIPPASITGSQIDFATIPTTGTGSIVMAISPTLTGTPTLPTGTIATTQALGNSSTAIATTAFVTSALGNASYKTILQVAGSHTVAKVAGTYALGYGDPIAVSGTGTLYPIGVIYISNSDYPMVNGVAPKLMIRAQLYGNDAAPTGNYTFGLYPVTRPGTSGGSGVDIYTLGTVVTGSNGATFIAPAADAMLQNQSADFAVPANGFYVIGVVTTSTVAANAHIQMTASLQYHN